MNISFYILELEDDKYYIGKTNGITNKVSSHFEGEGCEWTIEYPPIKLLHIYRGCKEGDELKYMLPYIAKYGIDNVRSTTYSDMILSEKDVNFLTNKLREARDIARRENANTSEYLSRGLNENTFHYYKIWTDSMVANDIMVWIINKNDKKLYFYSPKHGHEEKTLEESPEIMRYQLAGESAILIKETDDILVYIKRPKKKFHEKEIELIKEHIKLLE